MYLMYVDESGDPGTINSPTRYFVLSAIIFHETYWLSIIRDLNKFKRFLEKRYGLQKNEEIHAFEFISGKVRMKNNISRNDRLDLLKKCLDWLSKRKDISIISVCVNKDHCQDPFEKAWQELIQRFESTLLHKNFPGFVSRDRGIIFADNTNGPKLTKLVKRMRGYNQMSGIIPLRTIVEYPVLKDSSNSLILQMVDVVAYFARQTYEPNNYIRANGAKDYYSRLSSVLNKLSDEALQIAK